MAYSFVLVVVDKLGDKVRIKNQQKQYRVVLLFANNLTRTVMIKAASREAAERRALKHNPGALSANRSL